MDAAGWAGVEDVLALAGLERDELDRIVAENNKARYQLDGARIRASQGHSLAGTPVTLDALEASWKQFEAEGSVWHGTRADVELLTSIGEQGLLPRERSHVHLAESPDSQVGKRSNVGVLLEISPQALERTGVGLFVSPNGVVLAREVPPCCLVGLRALTKRARRSEAELRVALGLR